jgi:HEAT repeat protein
MMHRSPARPVARLLRSVALLSAIAPWVAVGAQTPPPVAQPPARPALPPSVEVTRPPKPDAPLPVEPPPAKAWTGDLERPMSLETKPFPAFEREKFAADLAIAGAKWERDFDAKFDRLDRFETKLDKLDKFDTKLDRLDKFDTRLDRFDVRFDGGPAVAGDVRLRQQSWYQGDAADSAYRVAYQLFTRQEYRSAADRFSEVRAKFPTTRYLCDAAYYEAFARYRLGTPTDLRTAYKVLDGMGGRCADASRREDVPELLARIDGVLARLGDNDAGERVRRAAGEGRRVCDREERNVKIQALSALAQMDPEGAKPILNTVLALRDDCSAPVRREALQLVARTPDAASIAMLARAAKSDPDFDTQAAAVEALGRINNDAAFGAIEELLRTATDERLQVAAARAMARSDNPRAQTAVRALAERKDVAERLRAYVIGSMAQGGTMPTEYWRSLYGKVESDELRRAVVNAVNRNSDEGMAFLLGIARGTSESSSVRELAISRVKQSAPIGDLYKLFETADSRSMRQSIVSGLAARREPEATDRLIDIAKRGTDPEVRATAIRYLGQPARRDDPKVRKALNDILGGQS